MAAKTINSSSLLLAHTLREFAFYLPVHSGCQPIVTHLGLLGFACCCHAGFHHSSAVSRCLSYKVPLSLFVFYNLGNTQPQSF